MYLAVRKGLFLSTMAPSLHLQHCCIRTPFGGLGIDTEMVEDSLMISQIQYHSHLEMVIRPANRLAKTAREQIEAYFDNPQFRFDLPMKPRGSYFQQQVWSTIESIPVGDTVTYGELANRMKTSPRAVGGACAANYYPLLIPCHRVQSKLGLGGFMGESEGPYIRIKRWLLNHEKKI